MPYACIEVPNLPIQAILRSEPQLRGKPVAVVDGKSPLRVVAANQESCSLGIRQGITSTEAAQIAPAIVIRRRSPAQEISSHAALLDAARSISPRVEDRAPGTVILDLAGLNSIWGGEEAIAIELAERTQAAGLDARIAVASNPDTAAIAARGFAGITHIAAGTEAERLAPLPVAVLEACPDAGRDRRNSVERKSEILETLARWGIRICGQLAALPTEALSERLGQSGVALQKLARGRAVREFTPTPALLDFTESMELDDAVEDLESFAFILGRLLHQLCARLGMYGLAAQELSLELELDSSGAPDSVRLTDGENANPQDSCYQSTLRLAVPSADVKALLKLWRLRLESSPPGAPILKATLSAVPAKPRAAQGDLFAPVAPDPQKLEIVLARLRNLVGADRVGSPELHNSHQPDVFGIKSFSALIGESKTSGTSQTVSTQPRLALRRFRPPLPVRVELLNGCPARIRFRGVSAAVMVASGPWRTRVNWWLTEACEIDEWDVEALSSRRVPAIQQQFTEAPKSVRETSLYRLHFDCRSSQWLLAGIYD